MHKLYYQPKGYWFGDCMPFGKGDTFYLFHQRDTRKPGPFGEPFGWDLATTRDFVSYEDKGEAIKRGSNADQDQFIFAGSIFEARDGTYHAFYTGYNRDYPKKGKPSQVLMHASSSDLVHWMKSKELLTLTPQQGYDPDDWRDPFVLWNEEAGEYLLILGARKIDGGKKLNGCTVQFTSKDLKNWTFKGEFWAPHIYTMHEMPDLFRIGDWWYLVISEYSDKNKIVYRMSKGLSGPWIAPTDDAFDGRAYYAGRTFCLNRQRILFGWVPTKEANDDRNNFEWAGTFVAHEVYQRTDGTLGVRPPETIWNAFKAGDTISDVHLKTTDSRAMKTMSDKCGDLFRFEAKVIFGKGTRSFGVKLLEDKASGEAYQFLFQVGENKYTFEKTPNQPWFQCMNIGLERPIVLESGKEYILRLIVDDTIATMYVDGVAMNTRMYTRPGDALSMFVTDGDLTIKEITIAKGLR